MNIRNDYPDWMTKNDIEYYEQGIKDYNDNIIVNPYYMSTREYHMWNQGQIYASDTQDNNKTDDVLLY